MANGDAMSRSQIGIQRGCIQERGNKRASNVDKVGGTTAPTPNRGGSTGSAGARLVEAIVAARVGDWRGEGDQDAAAWTGSVMWPPSIRENMVPKSSSAGRSKPIPPASAAVWDSSEKEQGARRSAG